MGQKYLLNNKNMKEVEVKAKISDIEELKTRLINLDCSFSEVLVQKDKIYLHNSIEFPDIKKGTVVLRIRNSNGKIILTLKKQLENELDNIEREIVIDNLEQGDEILKYMDFREVVKVNKERTKCKYKGFEICLDKVEGIGSFIEVEKLTTEEDSLKIQSELFEFLEILGIKKEDQVLKGYDTLIYELNNN